GETRRPDRESVGIWRHARYRQGYLGSAGGPRGGDCNSAANRRAWSKPDRYGGFLWAGDLGRTDRGGALSVSQRPGRRDQGRVGAGRASTVDAQCFAQASGGRGGRQPKA